MRRDIGKVNWSCEHSVHVSIRKESDVQLLQLRIIACSLHGTVIVAELVKACILADLDVSLKMPTINL